MTNRNRNSGMHLIAVLTALFTPLLISAAVPSPPSSVCIDNVCKSATAPGGGAVKWHPGHYMLFDGLNWSSSLQATHFAQMDALSSNTAIKGFELTLQWRSFETDRNNYAQGRAIIKAYLDKLASLAVPKRLMVTIRDRSFGACNGNWSSALPSYLNSSEFAGGAAICPVGGTSSLQSVAKSWEPSVMNRMIALTQYFADEFDANPNLEMFGWEGETAVDGAMSSQGYNWGDYWTQWKRMIDAAKVAWTRTQFRFWPNYSGSQSNEAVVAAYTAAAGVSVGGPDTNPFRTIWSDPAYNGLAGGSDYRGIVPWVAEVQSTAYQGAHGFPAGVTFQQLYDYAYNTMKMSYMVWYRNEWAGDSSQMWPANLTFINAHPGVGQTACPRSFSACATN